MKRITKCPQKRSAQNTTNSLEDISITTLNFNDSHVQYEESKEEQMLPIEWSDE